MPLIIKSITLSTKRLRKHQEHYQKPLITTFTDDELLVNRRKKRKCLSSKCKKQHAHVDYCRIQCLCCY